MQRARGRRLRRGLGLAMLTLVLLGAGKVALAESLDEALVSAYTGNPTLLAARAELRSVNEQVPQQLSNYRPSAFVDAQAGIGALGREDHEQALPQGCIVRIDDMHAARSVSALRRGSSRFERSAGCACQVDR